MKKLLLTTALVAVAFSNNSFAEIKVSGNIESTYSSISYDLAASQVTGSAALGSEANVSFTGTKDLSNGMKVNGAIRIEDKTSAFGIDQKEIGIAAGNFRVHVGTDTGANISENNVASVGQQAEDVFGGLSGMIAPVGQFGVGGHDEEHIGVSYSTPFGGLHVNYAPSNNATAGLGANSVSDSGGSIVEYVFTGDLGVKGLSVRLGQIDANSANGSGSDTEEKLIGATYSYGKAKVGFTQRDFDDANSTVEKDQAKSYSIAYAVAPNLSVSFERLETSKLGQTRDEVLDVLGVSYNLGGLGIEAYYGQAEDVGGAANADADAFQLRTVFAY